MSVLIKGMKMPDNCCQCMISGFRTAIKCTEWTEISAGRRENERAWSCPLVELPKHHGRLIDADRLMRVYEDRLEKVIDRYGVDSSERGILSGAMKLLMIELGIIEAKGDE